MKTVLLVQLLHLNTKLLVTKFRNARIAMDFYFSNSIKNCINFFAFLNALMGISITDKGCVSNVHQHALLVILLNTIV